MLPPPSKIIGPPRAPPPLPTPMTLPIRTGRLSDPCCTLSCYLSIQNSYIFQVCRCMEIIPEGTGLHKDVGLTSMLHRIYSRYVAIMATEIPKILGVGNFCILGHPDHDP